MSKIPVSYNIALDCVNEKAADVRFANRPALAFVSGDITSGQKEHGVKITYRHLKGLTDRAAWAFRRGGLKPGERILIRLPNVAEFPIAFLGAIKAGLLPVPVSPLLTQAEVISIRIHSGAAAIVTVPDPLGKRFVFDKMGPLCFFVADKSARLPQKARRFQEEMLKESAPFRVKPTYGEDAAFWLYTSGTSGRAKAVVHAHRSIPAHDARVQLWMGFKPGDVVFNTSALTWSYALTCGFLDVLRHGGTSLVYDGPPEAANLLHFVNRYGVTVLMSVPALYKRIVDYLSTHHVTLAHLRTCLSAADTMAESLSGEFLRRTGKHVYQGFGMTEHSVYLFQPCGEAVAEGTVGRACDPRSVKILRPDGTETDAGEVGVIATRQGAPGLMLGYAEGRKACLPLTRGWFLSGDAAFRDAAGNCHFCGRNDDMLNAGGFRVSPVEIESVLTRHSAVRDAAVVGAKKKNGATEIIAVIVLAPKSKKSAALKNDIISYCARYLAPYKLPKRVAFATRLPRTSNGKLKRGAVAKR